MADVLFGYLHSNDLGSNFHRSLLGLVSHDMAHQRRLHSWAQVKCAAGGIPEGRNQLAARLLENDDCDWLFMADSDMGFEPVALDLLLSQADPVERPIVGGLCFASREAADDGMGGFRTVPRPTMFDWVEHPDGHWRFTGRHHYPFNALVRCAATGGAFLLIHRTVLRQVCDEFGPVWFDRVRGTDNSLIGEDISFFTRTAALGIPCHVHTGIRTTHLKSQWVSENDFWNSFTPPPATSTVDVIVPALHRPRNVQPLMESLRASTGLASAWWIIEPGDTIQADEVTRCGGNVVEFPGSFAQKCNHGFGVTSAPWVLLAGDDVVFRPAWFDHACDVAARYRADVVGTNDTANPRVIRGEHTCHPMIRRTYVDEVGASWDGPGVVCHEGYRHWFVDDEIVTAARLRGVFQPAAGAVVEHHHPLFGTAVDDDVYRLGRSHAKTDEKLWRQRVAAHTSKRVPVGAS